MTNHPITPPSELVWEWTSLANEEEGDEVWSSIATQAARWGADQELEACCTWLSDHGYIAADPKLRTARRPKPPTLKEQALAQLDAIQLDLDISNIYGANTDTIRKALEALPND